MYDERQRKEIICDMVNASIPAERERHEQRLVDLEQNIYQRMREIILKAAQQALDELERERTRGSEQQQPAHPDSAGEGSEHILTP